MYTKTAQKKENTNNFSLPLFVFSLAPPSNSSLQQNYFSERKLLSSCAHMFDFFFNKKVPPEQLEDN